MKHKYRTQAKMNLLQAVIADHGKPDRELMTRLFTLIDNALDEIDSSCCVECDKHKQRKRKKKLQGED